MENRDIIVVVAAGRGLGHWIREKVSPTAVRRYLAESEVGQYRKNVAKLRKIDDAITDWADDLDSYVKKLRKAINSQRLVDVASMIKAIDSRLKQIGMQRQTLEGLRLTDKDLESWEKKRELPRFSAEDGIITSAGFLSDMKRKWIARHFETQQRRERTEKLNDILSKAEEVVAQVKAYVEELGTARISGDIESYITTIGAISDAQQEFYNAYAETYDRYLAPLFAEKVKEQHAQPEEEIVVESPAAEEPGVESPMSFELADEPTARPAYIPEEEPAPVEAPVKQTRSEPPPEDDESARQEAESALEHLKRMRKERTEETPKRKVVVDVTPEGERAPEDIPRRVREDVPLPKKMPPAPSTPFVAPKVEEKPKPVPLTAEQRKAQEEKLKAQRAETAAAAKLIQEQTKKVDVSAPEGQPELSLTEQLAKARAENARLKAEQAAEEAVKPVKRTPKTSAESAYLTTKHSQFMNELQKVASLNDPYLMGAMIAKYSGEIEEYDLDASLELLEIADGMING